MARFNVHVALNTRDAQSKLSQLGRSAQRAGAVMTAGLTAPVVALGVLTAKLADVQIQAERGVRVALTVSGQEQAFAGILAYTKDLQDLTTVGDEVSLKMAQVALNMGLTAEQAKVAVRESIALSAFGIAEQSAIRYTAALAEGDTTMLNRYIPTLRHVEDQAERVAKAHEILANAFEVAKEQARSGLGPYQQLRNELGDLGESYGRIVLERVQPFISSLREEVKALQESGEESKKTAVTVATWAAAVGPGLLALGSLIRLIGFSATGLASMRAGLLSVLGPWGLVAAGIGAALLALNAWISAWRDRGQREIEEMVRDANRLGQAWRDLQRIRQTGTLTDAEVQAKSRELGQVTNQLTALYKEQAEFLRERGVKSVEELSTAERNLKADLFENISAHETRKKLLIEQLRAVEQVTEADRQQGEVVTNLTEVYKAHLAEIDAQIERSRMIIETARKAKEAIRQSFADRREAAALIESTPASFELADPEGLKRQAEDALDDVEVAPVIPEGPLRDQFDRIAEYMEGEFTRAAYVFGDALRRAIEQAIESGDVRAALQGLFSTGARQLGDLVRSGVESGVLAKGGSQFAAAAAGGLAGGFFTAIATKIIGGFLDESNKVVASVAFELRDGLAEIDRTASSNLPEIQSAGDSAISALNAVLEATGATVEGIRDGLELVRRGDGFGVRIDSRTTYTFGQDLNAAINFMVLTAARGLDLSGVAPNVEAAIAQAIGEAVDVQGLLGELDLIREIDSLNQGVTDLSRGLAEQRIRTEELLDAAEHYNLGISGIVNELLSTFASASDDILSRARSLAGEGSDVAGQIDSVRAQFAILRAQAAQVNAEIRVEIELQKVRLETKRAEIETAKHQLQAALALGEGLDQVAQGIVQIAARAAERVAAIGREFGVKPDIDLSGVRNAVGDFFNPDRIRAQIGELESQAAAIEDLIAELDALIVSLDDLNALEAEALDNIRRRVLDAVDAFISGGSGIAAEVARTRAQLATLVDDLGQLADAGLLTREELARLTEQLEETALAAAKATKQDAIEAANAFIRGGDDLITKIISVRKEQKGLIQDLEALKEAGLLTGERMKQLAGDIRAAGAAKVDALVSSQASSILLDMLSLLGEDQRVAELKYDVAILQWQVAIAQLKAAQERFGLEIDLLDEIESTFNRIKAAGPDLFKQLGAPPPGLGGTVGTGANEALRRRQEALRQLVDVENSLLPDFLESLVNVGVQFDNIFSTLGRNTRTLAAYRGQLDQLNETLLSGINALLDEIAGGSLGGLSPEQRLRSLNAEFDRLAAAALGGDATAAQQINDVARELLDLQREFAPASFGAAQEAIAEVLRQISEVDFAGLNMDAVQQQIQATIEASQDVVSAISDSTHQIVTAIQTAADQQADATSEAANQLGLVIRPIDVDLHTLGDLRELMLPINPTLRELRDIERPIYPTLGEIRGSLAARLDATNTELRAIRANQLQQPTAPQMSAILGELQGQTTLLNGLQVEVHYSSGSTSSFSTLNSTGADDGVSIL